MATTMPVKLTMFDFRVLNCLNTEKINTNLFVGVFEVIHEHLDHSVALVSQCPVGNVFQVVHVESGDGVVGLVNVSHELPVKL